MYMNSETERETAKQQTRISGMLSKDMQYLNHTLAAEMNFDVVYRVVNMGGKEACIYFIDGFCKDEVMQKLLQYFMDMKPEDLPKDAHEMSKKGIPYVEVDMSDEWESILYSFMSGVIIY